MSIDASATQMASLRSTLLNNTGSTSLHERFRALFMLKAVGGDNVVDIISDGEQSLRPSLVHSVISFAPNLPIPF